MAKLAERPVLRFMRPLPLDDWYAVGLKLGIPDTGLDNVEKENWGKPKDQIREMFGLWLKRDTKATYGKLIEVLLRRKETESAEQLAKQIGVNLQTPPANTPGPVIGLDNKPELAVIIDLPVTEWYNIGLDLGLIESKLEQIKLDRCGDHNAMKREMLRTWLRQDSKASYRQLAKVLMASQLNSEAKSLVESIGHTLEEIDQSVHKFEEIDQSLQPIPQKGHTLVEVPQVNPSVRPQEVEVPPGVCTLVSEDVAGAGYCLVRSDGGAKKMNTYKMKSSPHGIALVISNIEFENGCGLKNRELGDVDERNLEELFSPNYLNYKFVLLKNLTGEQIDLALRLVSCHEGLTYALLKEDKEALKALSNGDNLISANHDSFVCCLLSHGTLNKVYGTNKKEFDLNNIYNYLGPCKHLSGKPKMVFIQACQGEGTAVVPPACVAADGDDQNARLTNDFMQFCAAFYGQQSFRWTNGEGGSWFINALCKTFKKNYKTMDVDSMMTEVHDEVTKMVHEKVTKTKYRELMQCPRVRHSLQHKVHFAVKGGWGLF